jgi:hypothetical protein
MRHAVRCCALALLLFTGCYGYYGIGYAYGYYWYPCCDDYHYKPWYPTALSAGDADKDGRLDLAVADARDGAVWIVRGKESGGFAGDPDLRLALLAPPSQVALLPGDDMPELVALGLGTGEVESFTADGLGGFVPLPPSTLSGVVPGAVRFASARLDADELRDVVSADGFGQVYVSLGRPGGAWSDLVLCPEATDVLAPDAAVRIAGIHLALGELDALPGVDLVLVDGGRGTFAYFSGRGDGTFGAARAVPLRATGEVLAAVPVVVQPGMAPDLAVLSRDAAGASLLVVLDSRDGSVVVPERRMGTASALTAFDVDGDGRSDLLLADAVSGTVTTLLLRQG